MLRLGRCFSAFVLFLSSSGWSNLFIIISDTLHSYASLLVTGRKPEDYPRCRGYNALCYQSFSVSRTQLRITGGSPFTDERQKPTIRNGNNCLEDDVLWYCGYNDHTTLKKSYVNNTRQEHFSNKNRRCQ